MYSSTFSPVRVLTASSRPRWWDPVPRTSASPGAVRAETERFDRAVRPSGSTERFDRAVPGVGGPNQGTEGSGAPTAGVKGG